MVPEKRTILAACGTVGALAAALALATGCAPVSYDTDGDAVPAANAVSESAEPEAEAEAEAEDEAPELAPEELTEKLVAKTVPRMGNVVTNEEGFILYRFDGDSAKPAISNCEDDCLAVWPAALTDGEPELDGVDPEDVGTVLRSDGTRQITIGNWPAYTYIGDKKAGQWKGQKVGGKWWVMDETGDKNLTCLPEGTPKAVAPPADDEEAEAEGAAEEEDAAADEEAAAEDEAGAYSY